MATARAIDSDDGDDYEMRSAGSQPYDELDEALGKLDEFENCSEVECNEGGDSGTEDVVNWEELTDNASDATEDQYSRYQDEEAFEDEDMQDVFAHGDEDEPSELAAGETYREGPAMLNTAAQHGMAEANNEVEVPIAPHALFGEQVLANPTSIDDLLAERKRLVLNPKFPKRQTGRSAGK